MVSIGTEAHVTKLIADSIEVAGAVVSGNKQFGPEFNQGELHHNGSVFFCKWSAVHQCASLATTSGSTTVTWTTSAAHYGDMPPLIGEDEEPSHMLLYLDVFGELPSDEEN